MQATTTPPITMTTFSFVANKIVRLQVQPLTI
jgi:hypothetical protein